MLNVFKRDGTMIGSLGTPERPVEIARLGIPAGTVIDMIFACGQVLSEREVTHDGFMLVPLWLGRRLMRMEQADRRRENDRRKRKPRNSYEWRCFGQRRRASR